uniref:Glycosyltransferase n=1 Tax=Calotropis gigantea TaxID=4066 RepID=A0A385Z7H9_CALGI|nr:steroid glycosyltransferase [Calotropis gigantea]
MGTIEISSPSKTHILAFPFPEKGHINPMLHLCNRLASKGFRVTLITTISTYKDVKNKIKCKSKGGLINLESIPDGTDKNLGMNGYFNQFKNSVTESVAGIIEEYKLGHDFPPPKVLIYDSTMPWMLDVAHGHGILGASLFTQPCCVSVVYYHMLQGTIDFHREQSSSSKVLLLPCLPPLEDRDLPEFDYFKEDSGFVSNLLLNQFLNIDKIDYVLFNTFEMLESEIANWMSNKWKILTIGPTAPTAAAAAAANNYLFETNTEVCMKWLDEREPNSVIYVSFGSIASLTEQQMEEISQALFTTNFNFLWVVREEERTKLPNCLNNNNNNNNNPSSESFTTAAGKLGLIINWCPQLDVLRHESVACFMTHCGWNSTLEAISSGVPMICVPQWVDQTTNAKFIQDVWKIGVRVNNNNGENGGLVKKEEIERCIKEVCESEKGKELKRNAMKWKDLSKEAVSEGGSSDTNLEYFASTLLFY